MKQGRARRKGLRGLTLFELLVVIGIVLVLAGLIFAPMSRSKLSAKTGVCTAQLRQVGQAWALYASDNGDRLPDIYVNYRAVVPYLGDKRLLLCPVDRPPYAFRLVPGYQEVPMSYLPNLYMSAGAFPLAAAYFERSEPNPVIFACGLHGKILRPVVSITDDTAGPVLRLRLDTSVTRPVIPVSCYKSQSGGSYGGRTWGVFSDYKPTGLMLDEVVGASGVTEVPCDDGG